MGIEEQVFNVYRSRSTQKLKKQSELGLISIPETPNGKENSQFKKGKKIVNKSVNGVTVGAVGVIKVVSECNGYYWYDIEFKSTYQGKPFIQLVNVRQIDLLKQI